jgi:hypothetical protein
MNYRDEIFVLRLDRRVIAQELGISYQALANRLNGFTGWQGTEERQFQKMIAAAKQEKEAKQ